MAHTIDVQRVQMSPDTVRHLLWLQGDTNLGKDGGLAFERLAQYIKAADEDERDWIAERHPDVVMGVILVMREHWALEWMRGLVKRWLDGLPVGDELDVLSSAPPFPPVSASTHITLVKADHDALMREEQHARWAARYGVAYGQRVTVEERDR